MKRIYVSKSSKVDVVILAFFLMAALTYLNNTTSKKSRTATKAKDLSPSKDKQNWILHTRRNETVTPNIGKTLNPEQECKTKTTLPNGAFCMTKSQIFQFGKSFDSRLCANAESLIQYSSVLDLGAGLGFYGRCLLKRDLVLNIDSKKLVALNAHYRQRLNDVQLLGTPPVIKQYVGYDGGKGVKHITYSFVKPIDLSMAFDLGKTFHWVLSLEVGEFIPRQFEQTFLNNLTKHSCKGIILSWADEGQSQLGHVNNRPISHVIKEMRERGFYEDSQGVDVMRINVNRSYFKNSLMVFRRRKELC